MQSRSKRKIPHDLIKILLIIFVLIDRCNFQWNYKLQTNQATTIVLWCRFAIYRKCIWNKFQTYKLTINSNLMPIHFENWSRQILALTIGTTTIWCPVVDTIHICLQFNRKIVIIIIIVISIHSNKIKIKLINREHHHATEVYGRCKL